MSLWRGQFAIKKAHDGRGYIVTHDGIAVAATLTLWGAERVLRRAKAAHEWNVRRAKAEEPATQSSGDALRERVAQK